MAITTVDGIVAGLAASTRQKYWIAKASAGAQLAGGNTSTFRSVSMPAASSFSGAAATCNNTTVGGFPFTNPPAGTSTYLARVSLAGTTAGGAELHDRLAHMGGLSGTLSTAQTVGIDLLAMAGTDNIAQRKGKADYSSVQWWIEIIAQTGGTAATLTISYTDQFGNAGKTTTFAYPATGRASVIYQIVPNAGDNIRSIESVTLSSTTGSAGNFGITATVQKTEIALATVNQLFVADFIALGFPQIYDSSCLFFITDNSTTSSPGLNGALTLIQG